MADMLIPTLNSILSW